MSITSALPKSPARRNRSPNSKASTTRYVKECLHEFGMSFAPHVNETLKSMGLSQVDADRPDRVFGRIVYDHKAPGIWSSSQGIQGAQDRIQRHRFLLSANPPPQTPSSRSDRARSKPCREGESSCGKFWPSDTAGRSSSPHIAGGVSELRHQISNGIALRFDESRKVLPHDRSWEKVGLSAKNPCGWFLLLVKKIGSLLHRNEARRRRLFRGIRHG